jgi:hypothetical protein
VTDPYNHDDDDDAPTLQRVSPTSSKILAAEPVPMFDTFADEATTATDLDALSPIADARDFDEIDTQKMPIEVRAGLVRASQVDDGA